MKVISSFLRIIHPKYWIYDFVKFTWIPVLYLLHAPKVRFYNAENKMPQIKGRAIVISNHTWWMDPIALIQIIWKRRLHSLAAVEVLGPSRLATWIRRLMLFVDIDRSKLDIQGFNNCLKLLCDEKCLLVFPEGRFVFEEEIQPFKGGTALMALQTNAPIYPVYIFGLYKPFRRIHLAIGDPVNVSDLVKEPPNSETIEKLNELLRARVNDLKNRLEAEIPDREIEERRAFKASRRQALAAKAQARAEAWAQAKRKETK